jgi:uncharacterized protein (UPF0248 family)
MGPSRRVGVVDDPALCLRLRPCRAMTRIQDPLNRIRWDREFGKARFAIGYCDRLEKALVRVPFKNISVPGEEPSFLEPVAPDGIVHSVPLHRVRAVWRNGTMIWQR